jgi:hypothetical protein
VNVSELVSAYLLDKNASEAESRLPNRLHVADIANGCTRAVWHRIHNGTTTTWTGRDLKKFAYGHAYESITKQALLYAGYELIVDEMIDLDGIIGHPDILAVNQQTRHLIEVKTTMLFRNGGKPPEMYTQDEIRAKQAQYIIQACMYAKHYDCDRFTVYLSDRGTGLDENYEFVTAEEWPEVRERIAGFKLVVALEHEPDPILPAWTRNPKGVSYLCKGCPVVTCAQNPNH